MTVLTADHDDQGEAFIPRRDRCHVEPILERAADWYVGYRPKLMLTPETYQQFADRYHAMSESLALEGQTMPLLSGPTRLPVDLPYLDRYCTLAGDEDGGVTLECGRCPGGGYLVAYLGYAPPPNATPVRDIASLVDAGMRHLAEYHPEP